MLSIGKFIPTSPEQQAGARLHRTARTDPQLNVKAQRPFSGEGEGRRTTQDGKKVLGPTHWGKDGCWCRVQPDAGQPGKAAGWVTAGWAAGVGVRGDMLHLAAGTLSSPWRVQLIGNELWSQTPPACLTREGEAWCCELCYGRDPEPGKGVNPATALLDAEEFGGLLEVTKVPQGL